MKKYLLINTVSIIAFVLFSIQVVHAQKTYNGASYGNWNASNNWSPAGIPASTDSVIVPSGKKVVVNVNVTVKSLTLDGSGTQGANVYIGNGITLTLTESLRVISGNNDNKNANLIFGYQATPPQGQGTGNGSKLIVKNIFITAMTNGRSVIDMSGNAGNATSAMEITGSISLVSTYGTLKPSTNSTVTYNGTGNQSVIVCGGVNSIKYSNLIIDKSSGIATYNILSGAQILSDAISASLKIKNGTLNNNGYVYSTNPSNSLAVNSGATYKLIGTTGFPTYTSSTFEDNSIVEFGGSTQNVTLGTSPSGNPNLKISGSLTKTLGANISVKDVAVQAGIFNGSTNTINVGGSFANSSTFTPSTGTVNFTGGTSSISGVTNLNNLSIASGATLTFPSLLNLTGNLAVDGTATIGTNVNFIGTSAQTISGTANSLSFTNLTLNNNSGVTIQTNATISNALKTTNGASTVAAGKMITMDLSTAYVDPLGSGSISGTFNFKKQITHQKSTFLGSPFTIASSSLGAGAKYKYDESKAQPWVIYTGNLTPGAGLSVSYENTTPLLSVNGTFSNATKSVSVNLKSSAGPAYYGWNLVGNPFAYDLNWDNVYSDNSSDANLYNSVYFYRENNYYTYSAGAGGTDGKIPAMQGFMVFLDNSGTTHSGSLTFNNTAGSSTASPLKREGERTNILNLTVTNGKVTDATYIRFLPDASLIFDRKYDAFKFYNTGTVPSFYSVMDNTLFSINSLPEVLDDNFVLPLGFYAQVQGEYTITLSEDAPYTLGYDIYLVDKLLNVTVPLMSDKKYTFACAKAAAEDRFELHFGPATITANVSQKSSSINAYALDKEMVLRASNMTEKTNLSIYDLTGKMVKKVDNIDLTSGEYRMSTVGLTGVYIIKTVSGSENYSEKLVLGE